MRGYGTKLVWNCNVDIERTIEAQRRCERRDDLRQKTIQVCVCGPLDVQVAAADIVQCLVVIHDRYICMFQQRVNTQHSVVRLNHCCSNLRTGPNSEAQLGLLAIVNGEALQHEAAEARPSASTDSVVHHESLQAGAVVSEFTDAVEHQVDDFFPDGIVATRKVVGSILLSSDKLLRVEELAVGSGPHLIDHSGFKVYHHATRHMLASTSLRKKCVERIIATTDGLVAGHLTIRLDAMLEAEELPTCITDLNTTLTKMKAEDLTHDYKHKEEDEELKSKSRQMPSTGKLEVCLVMGL